MDNLASPGTELDDVVDALDTPTRIISEDDFRYLEGLTRDVLNASRVLPGQRLGDHFGVNATGGTVIRPGGRETYPAFWIRDYAMSLGTDLVEDEEQRHMLLLTASAQCDQTWITHGGSMVPFGAIPDHINVADSTPIYFPGTYDYEGQGTPEYGTLPPYCDHYYFIEMATHFLAVSGDLGCLGLEVNGRRLIDRLEIAFGVAPVDLETQLVQGTERFRGVDFGFRDAIAMTGSLCYPSILRHGAAIGMAEIFTKLGDAGKAEKYWFVAGRIRENLLRVFGNEEGMLNASTGKSGQPDVWGTALALDKDLLDGHAAVAAARHLASAYGEGRLAYRGSVRHVAHGEDHDASTVWEDALVPKGEYQNGAYWGTPTGWVAAAIARVDIDLAARLVREHIDELRRTDFRIGGNAEGPYECFGPPSYTRGPIYLTTVSVPYIALGRLRQPTSERNVAGGSR